MPSRMGASSSTITILNNLSLQNWYKQGYLCIFIQTAFKMQRGGLSVIEPQTFSGIFYAEMIFPMLVLLVQDIHKLRRHASSVIFHLYYESVLLPPSCRCV